LVVLVGGQNATRFDSDHEPVFRQESYFWWLTGVKEPDCAFILDRDGNTTLLIPKLPADYATIMGRIKTTEEWQEFYRVDNVKYMEELEETLEAMVGSNGETARILLMEGANSDSGKTYNLAPTFKSKKLAALQDKTTLFPILAECRVIKSPTELALLEHVAQISSFAHSYVMRNIKPGMMEYQAESLFLHYA
jgi:Xaa-Pro dipeptidase